MEGWNITLDMAAIILLLMIFMWYMIERRISLRSHRAFLFLVTAVFIDTALEIAVGEMMQYINNANDIAVKFLFSLECMAIELTTVLLLYYVIVLANIDMSKHKALVVGIWTVVFIITSLNLINPFIDICYHYNGFNFDIRPIGFLIFVLCAMMCVASVYVISRHVREVSLAKTILLVFNLLFCATSIVLDFMYGSLLLCFSMAVCVLTLYQYLHNPAAMTDSTTGLFNRKFLGTYVMNEFSKNKRFGILMIAMDDFKFINKTYSVSVGDELLKQVGAFLISVRNSNMVFRFGSDQFCMLIRKDISELDEIAKKIEERFKHPWYSDSNLGVMMSASICSIECPKDADNYGNLIEVMDYSMSVAKSLHKGGISKAEDLELDNLREDKAIEKAVRLAMDRDELMVYYQPIFSVEHGVYNSAEALVRLHDEELGWVSPEKFIPIAEMNGLIVQMGETILKKVCSFIRDKKLDNTTIEYIEVNISPVQLLQENFVQRVKDILESYDVKPSQINMEITETATLGNCGNIVNNNIRQLVEYGIKFSLDDYGSGYANINYINHMPFSIIKLDKYIIWDAFKNDKAGITLEYTIRMLNALRLHIVAEGVETQEMNSQLSQIGCHYMQGWYYSKAVCDEEFMKLIETSKIQNQS